MPEVARWKWNQQRPIADPARERELLAGLAECGKEHRLDPKLVRSFFTAQIEAAKLIQQTEFDRWKAEKRERVRSDIDLPTLRRRIDRLNAELLVALAEAAPSLSQPRIQKSLARRAEEVLSGAGIDQAVRQAAVAPLRRPGQAPPAQ
jgi:chorismate mutase